MQKVGIVEKETAGSKGKSVTNHIASEGMMTVVPILQVETKDNAFEQGARTQIELPSEAIFAQLASELEVIASRLTAFQSKQSLQKANSSERVHSTDLICYAKKVITARKRTIDVFDDLPLLRSPGLDILLDLFVRASFDRRVSMTEASLAARCAPTTGLRWIGLLKDANLITKESDASDHRRSFIQLTEKGHAITSRCILAHSAT